jgi:tetratricopeptide (TPR) repeat protein
MQRLVLISMIAIALSFVGGFLLANAFNRAEIDSVRSENERLKSAAAKVQEKEAELTLSDEEINAKLAEADAQPENLRFQRSLGLALYRYASMKQDTRILADSIRILERAHSLDTSDRDIVVALGNAHFDIGLFDKQDDAFVRARVHYEEALRQQPNDANVRADLGLTYFLQTKPELNAAISEFKKALQQEPNHEKSLQYIVQSYWRLGDNATASEYLEQLRAAYPASPAVSELSAMLLQPPPDK